MKPPEQEELRVAVFASGSGSNFEAILEAIARKALPLKAALCVSNKPTAGALVRAAAHDVPSVVLDPGTFSDESEYTAALLQTLAAYDVNFVALAGYLRKIPAAVVAAFSGRMVNIHPALLPAFGGHGMYGKRVHQAVLDYGARWTGVTIHLVDEEFDQGPIVLQEPVPVYQDDTAATLAARVLAVEHRLYPEALRLFAEGRIHVAGRKVLIEEP